MGAGCETTRGTDPIQTALGRQHILLSRPENTRAGTSRMSTSRTAIEVAQANGVAVATVRKRASLLGGHKLFGRWRFPAGAAQDNQNGAVPIKNATRTLRELSEELSNLATIANHRDHRLTARLEEIERRLVLLENSLP